MKLGCLDLLGREHTVAGWLGDYLEERELIVKLGMFTEMMLDPIRGSWDELGRWEIKPEEIFG